MFSMPFLVLNYIQVVGRVVLLENDLLVLDFVNWSVRDYVPFRHQIFNTQNKIKV